MLIGVISMADLEMTVVIIVMRSSAASQPPGLDTCSARPARWSSRARHVGRCQLSAGLMAFVRQAWDKLPAMTELGPVAWPPAPIRTERLVLRAPEARDRAAYIELLASPDVGTYLGGPRPRDELERETPEVPERRPGHFVVDSTGAMIGQILLRRNALIGRQPPGRPILATCSCRRRGASGTPPRRARRPRLVRRRASRRAGDARYPDRQRPLDTPRGEAGVRRRRAVRGVRRRAVVGVWSPVTPPS